MKQILFNLVRNAIQASAPQQAVVIQLRAETQSLIFTIKDSGCGIDADVLPHIFEPFFSTKGELKEGMGLGLSVTRSLIESLGGEVSIETQPGEGTVFTVTLPREVSVETSAQSDKILR